MLTYCTLSDYCCMIERPPVTNHSIYNTNVTLQQCFCFHFFLCFQVLFFRKGLRMGTTEPSHTSDSRTPLNPRELNNYGCPKLLVFFAIIFPHSINITPQPTTSMDFDIWAKSCGSIMALIIHKISHINRSVFS